MEGAVQAFPIPGCDRAVGDGCVRAGDGFRTQDLRAAADTFSLEAGEDVPVSVKMMDFRCPEVLACPESFGRKEGPLRLGPMFQIFAFVYQEAFTRIPGIGIGGTEKVVFSGFPNGNDIWITDTDLVAEDVIHVRIPPFPVSAPPGQEGRRARSSDTGRSRPVPGSLNDWKQ